MWSQTNTARTIGLATLMLTTALNPSSAYSETSSTVHYSAASSTPLTLESVSGLYFQGDGQGVNCTLNVSQTGSYAYRHSGCGGVYAESQGEAGLQDSRLTLDLPYRHKEDSFGCLGENFIPVHWGRRTYLIASYKMIEFCNAVNIGLEPRDEMHGMFYLKQGDWDLPVCRKPVVGSSFSRYLLKKPLHGRIQQRLTGNIWDVDLGREHGVFKGMDLIARPKTSTGLFSTLTVREVTETSCAAELKYESARDLSAFKVSSRLRD